VSCVTLLLLLSGVAGIASVIVIRCIGSVVVIAIVNVRVNV